MPLAASSLGTPSVAKAEPAIRIDIVADTETAATMAVVALNKLILDISLSFRSFTYFVPLAAHMGQVHLSESAEIPSMIAHDPLTAVT